MSIRVINGIGKLYDAEGKQIIAIVNYQVCEQAEDTFEEWWGEFTLDHDIWPLGKHVIELEDRRKGTCFVKGKIQSVSGLPTVYRYNFQDTGTLT